jgi:hypothetical protein
MSEIHLARRSERNIFLLFSLRLPLHFMQIITIHQRKNNLVGKTEVLNFLFFLIFLPADVRGVRILLNRHEI